LGLPGCARGVTVPVSMKPKPNRSMASGTSAFLSKPAASPIGLGNSHPQSAIPRLGGSGPAAGGAIPARSTAMLTRCAASGGSKRSSGNARSKTALIGRDGSGRIG